MKKILVLLMVALMLMPIFANGAQEKEKAKTEEVVLRVIDWSDSAAAMRAEFNKKFEENNPGVKVEYTCLTVDQFKNTIITMIKGGSGPDLFPIPSPMTLNLVLNQDWYQSLEPYLTKEFKATINPAAFVDGITTKNGELYVLPENSPVIHSAIFYNKDILTKYGVTELPKTYSEFLTACKKVTEGSKGAVYGLIEGGTQLNRLSVMARAFASMAGGKIPPHGKILTVNGKANFDSPEMINSLLFIEELVNAGVVHPDTVSINAPTAREMFGQGQAAFLMQGMWCIPTWNSTYPDLNIGVIAPPVPDGQTTKYGMPAEDFNSWMGIYKQSKNPELAAKYLIGLYLDEYGYQAAQVQSGNSVSIIPTVNEKNMSNPAMMDYYTVATANTKAVPVATLFDEKAFDFYKEVKDINPDIGAIVQGVLAGSIKGGDIEARLEKLAKDSTAEWKRAAEVAKYDFNHLEFSNWDLTKDYTSADYAALK